MKTALDEKAESIKSSIRGTAEKSKETIREIIDSNSKFIDTALTSNKKMVESIKDKLDQHQMDDSITHTLRSSIEKSIRLAEDTLDGIINSYTRQLEMSVDFNTRMVDAIKESDYKSPESLLNLIQDNFLASRELAVNNTKEIIDFYNKHTNLAVNFNQKFGDTINAQLESMFQIQSKGLNKFAEWTAEWWRLSEKAEKK